MTEKTEFDTWLKRRSTGNAFGFTIEHALARPEVQFKTDIPKPPNRAVAVFSGGKFVRLLDHIGPGFSYLDDNGMLIEYMRDEIPGEGLDGLLIFEGSLHSSNDDCGYDEWIEGTWRRPTEKERDHIACEEWPWDPDLWLEDGWKDIAYGHHDPPPGPLVAALRAHVGALTKQGDVADQGPSHVYCAAQEVDATYYDLREEVAKLSTPERDVLARVLESILSRNEPDTPEDL